MLRSLRFVDAARLSARIPLTRSPTSSQARPRTTGTMPSTSKLGSRKHTVTIVGSGNWGSAIAKIIAENAKANPHLFEEQVQMWVYEEDFQIPKDSRHYDPGSKLCTSPQKLTSLINGLHENVKYLPGIDLPHNLVANPSLDDSVKNASVLVFNLPHQFMGRICDSMIGKTLPYARGISCIKGVDVGPHGVKLFSESIGEKLGIYCGALSGANIASEVALEKWSESTIAYDPPAIDSRPSTPKTELNMTMKEPAVKLTALPPEYTPLTQDTVHKLFHRPYFHIRMVSDAAGVGLGGALKNVVALAAGFVVGLGWGDNAKAAVMRVGIVEQVKFGHMFFKSSFQTATMTEESCGVADMITSCSGGRNFRCAKLSVERGVSIGEVEKTELNGQKLQGTSTAYEVNEFLKSKGMEQEFPLFTAVYNILEGNAKPEQIPDLIEARANL